MTGHLTGVPADSRPPPSAQRSPRHYSKKGASMLTQKSARPRQHALLIGAVCALVALFMLGASRAAGADAQVGGGPRPTIVLVHGDWADASTWTVVIKRLQQSGFRVVAPPNLLR